MKADETRKAFIKKYKKLMCGGKRNSYEVWSDLMLLCSASLSNPFIKNIPTFKKAYDEREQEYLKVIVKYDEEERDLICEMLADVVVSLEQNPNQDMLGQSYMELEISNKNSGQFFTPYSVCEAMANLTIDKKVIKDAIKKQGHATIYDPTVGGGATLIAGLNIISGLFKNLNPQEFIIAYGEDIDITCVRMAFIQMTALGFPCVIKHGSTLTDPTFNINAENSSQYYVNYPYLIRDWNNKRLHLQRLGKE